MLNQVLKVFSGTCQHSVEVLPKSVTFLDFRISQGSVATYCRRGGNFCDVYIKIFFQITGEKNLKIGLLLPKLLSNIKVLGFFGTRCSNEGCAHRRQSHVVANNRSEDLTHCS